MHDDPLTTTETCRIWCSTALNEHLDFPHVGQVFPIEREALYKKSGEITHEVVLGVTSRTPEQASPERILKVNRGHWTIENRCHYVIDWNFDEDRSRIRTGYGPENVTRLRRFACNVIQRISKGKSSISQKMQQLNRNTRLVFDYLRMTSNSTRIRSICFQGENKFIVFITVLAYQFVQIIRRTLQDHGIQGRWSSLRNILSIQRRVTVSFRRADGGGTLHVSPQSHAP